MGLLSAGKRFLLEAGIKKAGGNSESIKCISRFRPYHKISHISRWENNDYENGFLYHYKKIKIGCKGFFGDTCKKYIV